MFFDRSGGAQVQTAVQTARTEILRGPSFGWVRSSNPGFDKKGGAYVLRNIFPTTEGGKVRGGSVKRATCGSAAITSFAAYEAGVGALFAADATKLYEVSNPADPDVGVTASVTGLTNGDWSSTMFTTTGGSYLIMVNGADDAYHYDGSAIYPVDATAFETLPYDAETGTFAVGLVVTGGTSSATADIVAIDDNGTTGVLYIKNRSGTFQDNETITDTSTGSATSDIPSGVGTGYANTGKATSTLSHVWSFKSRLFFIEGGTLSAWHLPVDAVGGALTEYPLGGVFRRGGSLLFGATWSQDAGDGLDDYCVFVTDEGEVAIYQGTDPTDPTKWALVGVYRIGRPLDKDAHFKAGGDIGVLTDEGVVAISAAFQSERGSLQLTAISAPIDEAWKQYIANRNASTDRYSVSLHYAESMLMIGLPPLTGLENKAFVANTRTGAWAEFIGWDARSQVVYNDKMYFGDSGGLVFEANVGGTDNGEAYYGICLMYFNTYGSPSVKEALHARALCRTDNPYSVRMFANSNLNINLPKPLATDTFTGISVWDTAIWDAPESIWNSGEEVQMARTYWQTVHAVGEELAPGIIITSGQATKPDIEILSFYLHYHDGEVIG